MRARIKEQLNFSEVKLTLPAKENRTKFTVGSEGRMDKSHLQFGNI